MTKPCIAIVSSGVAPSSVLDAAIAARFGREGFECLLLAVDAAWLTHTCATLRGQGASCLPLMLTSPDAAIQGPGLAASVQVLLSGMAVGHYISVLACSMGQSVASATARALTPAMQARGNGTLLFTAASLPHNTENHLTQWVNAQQAQCLLLGINVARLVPEHVSAAANAHSQHYAESFANDCWQLHIQKPPIQGK